MTGKVSSTQKEKPLYTLPEWQLKEDIVISGMSGRFPESENVEQYKENLYNHVDMVTEDSRRWNAGMFGTPKGCGKLKDLEHFDASFFGVHGRMAASMDPIQRILLEVAYETIFDAGVDPLSLAGQNIGIYVGSSGTSVPDVQSEIDDNLTGYEVLGNSPAMMSNRTSFTFDVTGPSFTIDTGCSSSMFAMHEAVLAMRAGRCEAAVVAGCTLLKFHHTVQLNNTSVLSTDSRCKAYDKSANGFVRAEGIAAVFLQRSSDAKRCYATVLNCRINNDGKKVEGIMFPSAPHQKALLEATYSEINLDPRVVAYLECHGTGTINGDKEEGRVIGEVFCPNKDDRVLVTSVKTNMGHCEACSGISSLIKVILSFECGVISSNLHYKEPNPYVKALVEGRMKIVSENTPFKGGIVGISNFGFGGGNAHLIIESYDKEKKQPVKGRRVPRVVTACGSSEEAVKYILDTVRDKNFTDEAIVLLEEACKTTTTKMKFRGYTLFGDNGPEEDVIKQSPAEPRPVWFLYSGMGSQWSGMSKQMMRLEPFAKSIRESAEVLRPFGIDLLHLLTEATEDELNYIVHPFVTIAAVQIAQTDMLRSMGLNPDGIIGHSVGELGCAYADGTFTARQMLLAAYWRGKSCTLTQLIDGRMAAIGMTWEEAKRRCPTGVFPVCHNAQDSVTISGPTEQVETFVKQLKEENVFARTVKTGDIAFHSKYVEPASVIMRKELEKVIPNPVARSPLWVSSSVPEKDWNKEKAKFSSVDYHINNLLSPVLFNEAMTKVPKDALIIEIAPHSLLQPIVKRILGPKAIYVGLANKTKKDNLRHFLGAVGSLYNGGLNPQIKNLYDPVTFPVPRGTPMLNSLIKWNRTHWKTWNMFVSSKLKDSIVIDTIKGGPFEYVLDHKLDGRVMYTVPGYLWLAWKVLGKLSLKDFDQFPVMFEDVVLHRAAVLPKSGVFTFNVKIREADGTFIILEAGSLVASGKIQRLDEEETKEDQRPFVQSNNVHEEVFEMDSASFYRELLLRGYEFSKSFQGVTKCDSKALNGMVQWKGNWVTFLESVCHLALFNQPIRALGLMTNIRRIKVFPSKMPRKLGDEMHVSYNPNVGRIVSSAVEVEGLRAIVAPRRLLKNGKPAMEEVLFVPYMDNSALSEQERLVLDEYIQVCTTVATRALKNTDKMSALSSVLAGTPKASESLVNKYLKSNDEKHVLLHALRDIETNGKVPELSNFAFGSDLISNACLSEHSIRACLDCFLINIGSTKFNIVEISNTSVIYPTVDKMLRFSYYGHIVTNITVAKTTKDPLPYDLSPSASVIALDASKMSLPDGTDLVVAKDIFTANALPVAETVNAVVKCLKDNAFVIFSERTGFTAPEKCLFELTDVNMKEQNESSLEKAFESAGLTLIAKKKDGATFVTYLLRKINNSSKVSQQVFRIIEDTSFTWVEDLKAFMKQEVESGVRESVWVVDDRPESGICGMMQSIMKEVGGSKFRLYLNASVDANQRPPKFDLQSPEVQDIVKKDLRFNCYRNGQWGMFTNRIAPKEPKSQASQSCYLAVTDRGDLSSLRWIHCNPVQAGDQDIQAKVVYSGLNENDLLAATGKIQTVMEEGASIHSDSQVGLEFSGLERKTGRRIMGLVASRGLANVVSAPESLTFNVPDKWSLEDAATVPFAYLTAYYALADRGRVVDGETVLIHSGTGAVGQAALTIALARGSKVITTVDSEEQKNCLLGLFNELNQACVINHQTEDLEDRIMSLTSRSGLDIVLGSSSDLVPASVRCIKRGGKFLDLRVEDTSTDTSTCKTLFAKNVEYHGINMSTLLNPKHQRKLRIASEMLREGIRKGEVKPLKRTVFASDQVVEAFRYTEPNTHIGKVLIQICEEPKNKDTAPVSLPAQPKMSFCPNKSVVVTGGLGGMGFELALWLVEKGVKKMILSSRSGLKNSSQRYWMQKWQKAGLQVKVCNEDITTHAGCRALLAEANKLGPVGAIFQLAVIFRDGLLENLSSEDYATVGKVKVGATRILDECSRDLCPELDYFVGTSSILTSKGVGGLGNYCYGNSAIERVCEQRHRQGLPGFAIEYGGIFDAGVIADEFGEDSSRHYDYRGSLPLSMAACFSVMEKFVVMGKPVMSYFTRADETDEESSSRKDLLSVMCNILGVSDPSSLHDDATLGSMGMDSLMVVEAKQLLDTDYQKTLSIPQVLKLSIRDVKNISDEASKV